MLQYDPKPGVRGPATYTLLSEQPLPDVKQPSPNNKQPLPDVKQRAQKPPLLSLEESPEESQKNRTKNPNKTGSLNVPLTQEGKRTADLMEQCVLESFW